MEAVTVNKNLLALLQNHEAAGTEAFKDIVLLEGSSRSGKTWSIMEYFIQALSQMPRAVCTCFRNDASTHEKAAIRDFKMIMASRYPALWKAGKWISKPASFTFSNGAVLEFTGTNDPMKLHGPERDFAWLNEAMEISYEAYLQIAMRTRLMTVMDWNPSLNHHWVFDRIMSDSDAYQYIHSTYLDNPYLSSKQVAEIEKTKPTPANVRRGTADRWHWEVYGEGKRGRREGTVYKYWQIVEAENWPKREYCQRFGYGLDWGFSQDPAAVIECAWHNGGLWLRQVVYDTGLLTVPSEGSPNADNLHELMIDAGMNKNLDRIIADSASPGQIAELRAMGWQISGAQKGPKSVEAGVRLLQGCKMHVHRDSIDLQRELEQYAFKRRSSDGVWMAVPEDKYNHAMDAVRYWAMSELRSHAAMTGQSNTRRRSKVQTGMLKDYGRNSPGVRDVYKHRPRMVR